MPILQLVGRVVSNRQMQKTAKVSVTRMVPHHITNRLMRVHKIYFAHDQNDERMPGDIVRIQESRPLSKHKRFTIIEVLREEPRFTDPATGKTITKYTDSTSLNF